MMKDPLIQSALMFGRAKFHVGILVDPVHPFDPANVVQLAEFRNSIW